MNAPVTIDASVFVSAFTPTEPAHHTSRTFLLNVRQHHVPGIVPVLVLPEISAALARGQGKPSLGKAFVRELKKLPNTTFVDVDEAVADLASDVAADHRLRGSDAIYAAVALRFGTELVTLDRQQRERLSKLLRVAEP